MPDFHNTGFGHRFFNAQLPALTTAIGDLAAAVSAPRAPPDPDPPLVLTPRLARALTRAYNEGLVAGVQEGRSGEIADEVSIEQLLAWTSALAAVSTSEEAA